METSKHYSKRIGKIFKKNHDVDISQFQGEFLPAFVESFKMVSEDVANEVFHKLVTYSERDFKEAVYNLVNIFELFEENYDVDNDPLSEEEWSYLKLLINDSSDDLDIDNIKYIMQVMLDLGHL